MNIDDEENHPMALALGISDSEDMSLQYPPVVAPVIIPVTNTDMEKVANDADHARQMMYDNLANGQEAINNAQRIAKESMEPRAFEVLALLLKQQSDAIEKLLKIQKDKKDIANGLSGTANTGSINIERAVFVGSTSELLDMMQANKALVPLDHQIDDDD